MQQTCKIPLTRGKFALIDKQDQSLVSNYKWNFRQKSGESTGYATTNQWIPRSKNCKGHIHTICMHRLILSLRYKDGKITHHINGNGLDNRRCNIKISTPSENMQCRRVRFDSKTGIKGIVQMGKYIYVKIRLGPFKTVQQAAKIQHKALGKLELWIG